MARNFKFFLYFITIGALISIFIFSPKKEFSENKTLKKDQSFFVALKEAFTHKGYILLVSGFFVCGFQITLIATHIPGYMQERGMGGWSATIILALIGLFNIIGTLTMGYLGTKYRKKFIMHFICFKSVSYSNFYFFARFKSDIYLFRSYFWFCFGYLPYHLPMV